MLNTLIANYWEGGAWVPSLSYSYDLAMFSHMLAETWMFCLMEVREATPLACRVGALSLVVKNATIMQVSSTIWLISVNIC